jgi:hypothetical protein
MVTKTGPLRGGRTATAVLETDQRTLEAIEDPGETPLPVLGSETGQLLRHPDDGWELAQPLPMGKITRNALRSVIRAFCPIQTGPWNDEYMDRLEVQVRTLMSYMDPLFAKGLCLLFILTDWAPIWRLRSWRRLRSIDRHKGIKVIDGILHGQIFFLRQMMLAVRAAIFSAYYDQPEVHFEIGYHPVPWMRDRIALRRRLLAGESAKDEDMIPPFDPGVKG